jgi:DNA-binding CsgD family transcriptional regulator
MVVTGGPSVGKTALVGEIAEHAAAEGFRTLVASHVGDSADAVAWLADRLGVAAPDAFPELAAELGREPTLLSVDGPDPSVLRLVSYLARRLESMPVLVVLTETTGRPWIPLPLWSDLLRHGAYHLPVVPLPVERVAELLARHRDAAAGFAEECHALTGGNPRLVNAYVYDGLRPGAAFSRAVLACVCADDDAVFDVAQCLAVLGEAVTPSLVAELARLHQPVVRQAVTVLEAAGLLRDGRFRHAAIDAAVLEHMTAERRAQLHLTAARLLHDGGFPASVVARHLLVLATHETWMIGTLRAAAQEALGAGHPEFGVDCLRTAARISTEPDQRAALIAALTDLTWHVDPHRAARLMPLLPKEFRREVDTVRMIKRLVWHGDLAAAGDTIDEVDATDPRSRAELKLTAQWLRYTCPSLAKRAQRVVRGHTPAVPEPSHLNPVSYTVTALATVFERGADVDTVYGAEEMLAQCRLDDLTSEQVEAALLTLVYADRLDRARAACDLLLDQARERRLPLWSAVLAHIRADIALRLGDTADARRSAEQALHQISEAGWGVAIVAPLACLALASAATGGAPAEWLNRRVPEAAFATRYGLSYLYARGQHHLLANRPAAALDDFRAAGALAVDWGLDLPVFLPWRQGAAAALLRLADPGEATRLLHEEHAQPSGGLARVRGVALRLLAGTVEPAESLPLLDESVHLLDVCGNRLELIAALADRGRALHEVGATAKARKSLQQARRVARECGAADPVSTASRCRWDASALTVAECRVAELAAGGHTNREIGDRLAITRSTVEQHLTKVYRKLAIRSRADLVNILR